MPTLADQRLATLAAVGGPRGDWAFEQIVIRYRPRLVNYARRLVFDQAEDVVQTALLSAGRQLRDGVRVESLKAWLYGCVRYRAIDELRVASRRSDQPLHDEPSVESAHDTVARMLELRAVFAAIQGLTPRYRAAVVGCAVQGRTPPAVARELGERANTVSVWLHRGRRDVARAVEQGKG